MSFLRFDVFCLLIISPAIVPERISISDNDSNYDGTDDMHEPRDCPLALYHSDAEKYDEDNDS